MKPESGTPGEAGKFKCWPGSRHKVQTEAYTARVVHGIRRAAGRAFDLGIPIETLRKAAPSLGMLNSQIQCAEKPPVTRGTNIAAAGQETARQHCMKVWHVGSLVYDPRKSGTGRMTTTGEVRSIIRSPKRAQEEDR